MHSGNPLEFQLKIIKLSPISTVNDLNYLYNLWKNFRTCALTETFNFQAQSYASFPIPTKMNKINKQRKASFRKQTSNFILQAIEFDTYGIRTMKESHKFINLRARPWNTRSSNRLLLRLERRGCSQLGQLRWCISTICINKMIINLSARHYTQRLPEKILMLSSSSVTKFSIETMRLLCPENL